MSEAVTRTVPAEPDQQAPVGSRWRSARWAGSLRPYAPDVAVCLAFLLLAAWLTHGLWPDPTGRMLAFNQQDQVLYEWFLANDARVLSGEFGLLTDRLNAPDGVNMLANTTIIVLGVLLAPVTVVFGGPTTFALILAGNLALTAIAWYLLYARTLGAHRMAAALGAGLCGFAPGMVSQSNGHLHMTAQWLVPVIVWLTVRLLRAADAGDPVRGMDAGRVVTSALGLAVVITVQVFIGEEVLFLTALTLLLVTVAYAVLRPALVRRVARGFVGGMSLAAGLAVIALGYPLWFQFGGPQSVHTGLFNLDYFSADRASWAAFSPLSLAGGPHSASLAPGAAEYNTFLGWPLLLVVVGCAVWLVRRALAISCVGAGIVLAGLSLGPQLVANGVRTGIPGPYALLRHLPLFDAALPTRFALAVVPLVATVLVLAVDRALRGDSAPPDGADRDPSRSRRWAAPLVPGLVAAGLLPIFPVPLPTADRPALPEFVTAGHWRDCVEPAGVLVPVPLPTPDKPWVMRWATAADAEFGVPEGFFIGPYGPAGGASMGTAVRPTSALLADVAKTGAVPRIGRDHLLRAQEDVDFWRASCIVLDPAAPHVEALHTTLDGLFGPAAKVADVWTWKVRSAGRPGGGRPTG